MSYILNALRKSEQERQASQSAANRILIEDPIGSQRKIGWIPAILVGNLIVVATLVWYVDQTKDREEMAEVTEQKPVVTMAKPIPAEAETQAAVPKTEKPVAAPVLPKSSIAELAKENSVPKVRPPIEKAVKEKQAIDQSKPARSVPAKPDTPPVAVAPVNVEPAVTEPKPFVTEPFKPEPAASKAIPWLGDMPFEFRHSVPSMKVNVFVYANDPSDRFVLIDMTKFKSGQTTKDGVEIIDIRSDSLVARFNGQVFRIARP